MKDSRMHVYVLVACMFVIAKCPPMQVFCDVPDFRDRAGKLFLASLAHCVHHNATRFDNYTPKSVPWDEWWEWADVNRKAEYMRATVLKWRKTTFLPWQQSTHLSRAQQLTSNGSLIWMYTGLNTHFQCVVWICTTFPFTPTTSSIPITSTPFAACELYQ